MKIKCEGCGAILIISVDLTELTEFLAKEINAYCEHCTTFITGHARMQQSAFDIHFYFYQHPARALWS